MQEDRVREIIAADAGAMAQLRAVRALALPDWWIAGGFVRNRVWDCLSGSAAPYRADTDVLFFDPVDMCRIRERELEATLARAVPDAERLETDDRLSVVAPLGLDDLLGLVFRPSDAGRRHYEAYRRRIDTKPWRAQWPHATFIV